MIDNPYAKFQKFKLYSYLWNYYILFFKQGYILTNVERNKKMPREHTRAQMTHVLLDATNTRRWKIFYFPNKHIGAILNDLKRNPFMCMVQTVNASDI